MHRIFAFLFLATAAQAEPPNILTDIPAIHSLAAQVTGDLTSPTLLLTGTDDPHHTTLRPSQARALTKSDLIIWTGPALTPWLETTLAKIAPETAQLQLLSTPDTTLLNDDPHAWLDPNNAANWLTQIANTLATQDPENAATYHQNATTAGAKLKTLITQLTETLTPAQDEPLITAHNAYAYFANRFDLTITATLSDSDDTPPSAARIAKLRTLTSTTNIACIFADGPQNDAIIETLTENTTIPTATLDPIGATIAQGPDLYGTLLTNIATSIAACISP